MCPRSQRWRGNERLWSAAAPAAAFRYSIPGRERHQSGGFATRTPKRFARSDLVNRVRKLFRRLKAEHRCGLIAYITCGDGPTIEIIRALEEAGADAIELGVPFSDPIADGPVIQAAAMRALKSGTKISDIFTIARAVRERSEIPLIAFSYLNPVLRHGIEKFADDAHAAGIDSV